MGLETYEQKKILAITFTKKAKEEMQTRLNELKTEIVQVETFNSFAEKYLKKYGTVQHTIQS